MRNGGKLIATDTSKQPEAGAMTYSVDALVSDLKRLAAEHSDPKDIAPEVVELAKRIAAETDWIRPDFYEVDETQGIGITVLHEEADHTLLVEAIVWAPGKGVLPHDHQTWGVVVGLDGTERNTIWRREDDGATPGHAKLVKAHEMDVGKGQAIAFMPNDIHSVTNLTDRPSLSLHIYGKSLAHVSRSEFDPAADAVRPCPIRAKRQAA